jgi:hypothetical protein
MADSPHRYELTRAAFAGRREVPPTRGTFGHTLGQRVDVRDTPLQPAARQRDGIGRASSLPPPDPGLIADPETRAYLDLREQVRAVALARRLLRLEIGRLERLRLAAHAETRPSMSALSDTPVTE